MDTLLYFADPDALILIAIAIVAFLYQWYFNGV